MKHWLPSIILVVIMFLLVAATRVYVGGPDGLEFVWKGELNFADTVVNVDDFAGIPRKDLAANHSESLLSQMEDMDLLSPESERPLRRRVKKKNLLMNESHEKAAEGSKDVSSTKTDTEAPAADAKPGEDPKKVN